MKPLRSYWLPLLGLGLLILAVLYFRAEKKPFTAPPPTKVAPCLGTFYPCLEKTEEILFTHITDKVRFRIGKDVQFHIFTELLKQLRATPPSKDIVQERLLGYIHFKGPFRDVILGLGDTRISPVLETEGNAAVQFVPPPDLANFLSQLWKYGSTVSYPKIASHLQEITFPNFS